jgi:hypothetical protein
MENGNVQSAPVSLKEHPAALVLMRVEPPRLLHARPSLKEQFNGDIWWTYLKDDAFEKAKRHGGKGIRLGSFNPGLFARMLAKIAHSFAVADQGFEKFTPLLPDLILGRDTDLSRLVGGEMVVPPAIEPVHRLHLEVGWVDQIDYTTLGLPADIQFLVVHIRLFAFLGTPQYHVVVGIWNERRTKGRAGLT